MKVTDDTRRVDGSTLSRTQTLPEASYRGGRVAPRRRVSLASFKSLLGLFLAGVLGAAASDGAFAKYMACYAWCWRRPVRAQRPT